MKQCVKCKKFNEIVIKGLCKTCYQTLYRTVNKEYADTYNDKYRELNRTKINNQKKIYKNTLSGKYVMYKGNAKRRKVKFDLTLEQFNQFWKKPCYYTGIGIKTIGIDRLDNNKGYTVGNCVPCCEQVNMMKGKMSKKNFIKICKIIAGRF